MGDDGRGARLPAASALLLLVQRGRRHSRRARAAGCVGRRRNKRAPNLTPIARRRAGGVRQRQAGGPVETPCLCLVAGVVRVVEGPVHRLPSAFLTRLVLSLCLSPSPLLRCRAARSGRVGRQRERIPHVQR